MKKSRSRNIQLTDAEVRKLISTVMEHFEARIFMSEIPLSLQIEHLELEIYLRDTMIQANHFAQRVEDLKSELKVKEMYYFAKKRGLLKSYPKALSFP